MRNISKIVIAATLGTACSFGFPALAQDVPVEQPPLPHAEPLPPPPSLQPGMPMDSDNGNPEAGSMPQDQPTKLGGIETVCTGTGSAKDDPQWATYPIRIEFSNGAAQYLSGMHVTLSDKAGKQIGDFVCWGPWVLVRAPAGSSFKVTASLSGVASSPVKGADFTVPAKGQKRVELTFPGMEANQ
ncbi:MAG: hypothetical protein J0H30_03440 [Alphaproteobacteria bacterium]|nr:hypothetical protein [Alphaproteobacteria bacterium]